MIRTLSASVPLGHTARDDEVRDLGPVAFAACAMIGLGAVLVLVRGHVAPAVVALILACGVMLAGQIGGRWAGVGAAAAAAVSFNFFHTQPYLSLRIHDVDDVVTTLTLLIVGLAAGFGSDLTRGWHRQAELAAEDLDAVEQIAALVRDGTDAGLLADAATSRVRALIGLATCEFVAGTFPPDDVAVIKDSGALACGPERVYRSAGFELPTDGVAIAVRHRGRSLGYLRCVPRPAVGVTLAQRRAAVAIGGLLGAGLGTT